MEITRRRFLGCAAGAMTMALPLDLVWPAREPRPVRPLECAVLDLKEHCAIRDSLYGYESALADLRMLWTRTDGKSVTSCATIIVPAALLIRPPVARLILRELEGGSTVVLESGAQFNDGHGPEFRAHRDALRDSFQIDIEPPVALWPRHAGARALPYVEYTWPAVANVRDFSRVVPITPLESSYKGTTIANVDGLPAAVRRRIGSGTLVILGSPLGPALWAGDLEAKRWFRDVLSC